MEGHCTSEKPPFLRRQPVFPRASPAPDFARWLARVALARLRACSLWGRGPARALPTRARLAALATLTPRTMEGHCTSEKPPFLRRQPVLPRASPASDFARWLARVARLHASALALSGGEAQHVRFRRARAAPRWRYLLHAPWKGTARARSRGSFGARPVLKAREMCVRLPSLGPWLGQRA